MILVFCSGDESSNVNVTSWNKPWPPEIDWFDPYLNLSSLSRKMLDGIILGDKLRKSTLYRMDSYWGREVIWMINPELADQHYFQHYVNTNRTMFVCGARFPTRMDLAQLFVSKGGQIVICFNYEVGMFADWMKEEQGDWSYIWSTYGGTGLVAALSMVGTDYSYRLNGNNLVRYCPSVTEYLDPLLKNPGTGPNFAEKWAPLIQKTS